MALSKQIGTDYGIVASYWKITDVALNSLDGTARVVVSGYPDRETRFAGYLPIKTLQYSVSAQDVQTYFPSSLDIAQVYGYLKTLGDFIFAEDA